MRCLHSGIWVRFAACGVFSISLAFLLFFSRDPTGTLSGGHTDHVAHIGETRAFSAVGIDLWRKPAKTLFRLLRSEEINALPADVRDYTRQHPEDMQFFATTPRQPLAINFFYLPRCYPPGVFVVSAPSAILYHFGVLSFHGSNLLFLLLLQGTWLLAVFAWTAAWKVESPSFLRQVATVAVAGYVWYWTIEGMYDIVAVALGSLAVEWARRQRHADASLLWGLAVSVHPRLLALLPISILAIVNAFRNWKAQSLRERFALILGAFFVAGGLFFAVWIQPSVRLRAAALPHLANVLRVGQHPINAIFGLALIALVGVLWQEGNRWDAAIALFCGVAFCFQPFLTPWYWFLVLPWALGPAVATVKMTNWGAIARASLTVTFLVASLAFKR
jgi:hypothetical protein